MASVALKEVIKTEYQFVAKNGQTLVFEKEGEIWHGLVCLALVSNPSLKMIVSTENLLSNKLFDYTFRTLLGEHSPCECLIFKISSDLVELLGVEQ